MSAARSKFAERLFRWLVLLYPSEFRGVFGQEMVVVFRDRLRHQRAQRGWLAVSFWLCREIIDVVITAANERRAPSVLGKSSKARREAARIWKDAKEALGNPLQGGPEMHSIWQDVVYSVRTLTKRPGFSLAAIVALGLGIGANTAIFSVVHNLMFRPLPVEEPGELVALTARTRQARFSHGLSYPDFRDYASLKGIFEDAAVHTLTTFQITAEGRPERVLTTVTSGNFFTTLGLGAAQGRVYTPEEGAIGGESVMVLDHAYWQSRFGGDPSVVGQTVSIQDQPVTIIGVMPESFQGVRGFVRTMVYIPFSTRERLGFDFKEYIANRAGRGWYVVARLRDGVSLEGARSAVGTMAGTLEEEHPETNDQMRAFVFPEPQVRLEPAAADFLPPIAAIFMVLVSLVLLIACANAANLLLARASERRREMALRSALGAGRARILRQLLTESLLISLAGGVAGLVMAYWACDVLSSIRMASDLPLHFDFSMDYRVFGYAFLVALAAGLISGLAPGVHAARANIVDALKEGGRTGVGYARQPLRSILVAAQVAISLVLLVCTALFLQSMRNVTEIDPGFQMRDRVMLTVDTTLRNYDDDKARAFFHDLLDRVRSLPGVGSAAMARFIPMGFDNGAYRIFVEGEGEGLIEEQDSRQVFYNNVSPDYFSTLEVPILEGRDIGEQDVKDGRKVAVINQKMAEQFWPDENPIGKRFSVEGTEGTFWEVIGISKQGFYITPGEPPMPYFYRPLEQSFRLQQTLFVHAEVDPTSLLPAIREEVRALDPDMPVFDVRTLESHVTKGKAVLLFHLPAQLVGAFAAIGAVLAALGLYGVIAYSVTQRTHEIGIRVALGASSSSIVRLVLSKGIILGALGIGLGVLLAIAVTSTFAFLLVGVSAKDPTTYVVVSLLVLLVTLTACFIPARFRAARIDPVIALRDE